MNRKEFLRAGLGLLYGAALCGCGARGNGNGDTPREAPAVIPVVAATATLTSMPMVLRTFGAVEADQSVMIKSQITGVITGRYFTEGCYVRAGDLLFSIDARPSAAALRSAAAALARNQAQLDNARRELQRQDDLQRKGFAAEDALDQARTAVSTLEAAVQVDQAAVDNARLQLEYCSIRTPISGRTGDALLDAGNLVKANDSPLVGINQMDPILVRFTLPQQELPGVQAAFSSGVARVDARSGTNEFLASGRVVFINNEVDAASGTLLIKAQFSNTDRRLWPGQFVRVEMTLVIEPHALVVPSSAVLTGQKGTYLYVVKPDRTVEDRMVSVNRVMDENTVLAPGGVAPGEQVVTDGQMRLAPGAAVQVKAGVTKPEAAKP